MRPGLFGRLPVEKQLDTSSQIKLICGAVAGACLLQVLPGLVDDLFLLYRRCHVLFYNLDKKKY